MERFKSFKHMLQGRVSDFLPGHWALEDAVRLHLISSYNANLEEISGALAIELEPEASAVLPPRGEERTDLSLDDTFEARLKALDEAIEITEAAMNCAHTYTYLCINRSNYLSIYTHTHICIYLSIYPHIYPSICLH